jgi:isocitrate dehydrogenase
MTNDRKKVTCFTKDNILKLSDGLFHQVFDEISSEYPKIENEHWIVDIGAAKLADSPENFDVVVMPNLYGDILSDVAAQIAGSVGLAGSANIGKNEAMFEAIHGSAPRHAGKNDANPSGLLLGAIMMLVHIGQPEAAARIHNAWLKTIEDGIHTYDIFKEGISTEKVGTKQFAEAVVQRMGQKPQTLKEAKYSKPNVISEKPSTQMEVERKKAKELVGVDIFVEGNGNFDELTPKLERLGADDLQLTMVANRGVGVWPNRHPDTSCIDTWRCRYKGKESGKKISNQQVAKLIQRFADSGIDFVQTEHLYTFDGQPGFTVAQDEQ